MTFEPRPVVLRSSLLAALVGACLAWCGLLAAGPASAAPGPTYVDDATCGRCHTEIWRSYQAVGMARSFTSGEAADRIETWSGEGSRFHHAPSGRWYEMKLSEEGRPVFSRWMLDADGEEIHRWQREVDWILGSGHTSRSYLVHLPGGELFLLPVSWYSQEGRWDMAPGFEFAGHLGLQRLVPRECMFCHNAYPRDLASRADGYGAPHVFPRELPHGTGCQRCHGPGSQHVDAAILGGLPGAVARTIVNPARLETRLRDDVCRQCHMQPAVNLMPTRRFGRDVYSYRPGEPLEEYVVFFDPEVDPQSLEAPDGERFEINHHPYRLEQSPCWIESRDQPDPLSCLTCHDPHRKVPPAERATHYRRACLSCHQLEACDVQRMGDAVRAGLPANRRHVEAGDCVGCHMPRRRTRDVTHVVMTDHEIQARPGGAELTAPLAKSQPLVLDLDFLYPERAPEDPMGEVYRAYGAYQAGSGLDSGVVGHFERHLRRAADDRPEPWLELAGMQIRFDRPARALPGLERATELVAEDEPAFAELLERRAVVAQRQGRLYAALRDLKAARSLEPDNAEIHFRLGLVYLQASVAEEALEPLRRSLELRPLLADGWLALGLALAELERHEEAIDALREALAVEPSHTEATIDLGRLLAATGERGEALRILRHGARWAADGEAVGRVLEEITREDGPPPAEPQAGD